MSVLRRFIVFTLLTGLLVAAVLWLFDQPGEVTVHWRGWRLDTSVPVLLLVLVAVFVLLQGTTRLARAIIALPSRWLALRRERRRRLGYLALSDGLAATAVGDKEGARKWAAKARALLGESAVTGLLSAQAAALVGDEAGSDKHYRLLTERAETALTGYQGLMALATKRGDRAEALGWARKAWAGNAANGALAETLYGLLGTDGLWDEAHDLIAKARRRRLLPKERLARLDAVALMERSRQTRAAGNASAADSLALAAHRADPGLAPAAILAAHGLTLSGNPRKASKIIAESWRRQPHADLADAWADLVPDESPLDRVSRLTKLMGGRTLPTQALAPLARAELAAQLWGQARLHLETLIKDQPSRSVCLALAELERRERNDEAAARGWLDRASKSPDDPAWECAACHSHAADFAALCPQCGAPASLEWRP